jgi:hypothetical protein
MAIPGSATSLSKVSGDFSDGSLSKPLQAVHAATSKSARKKCVVAAARQLAVDLWRISTGQCTGEQLGLITVEGLED